MPHNISLQLIPNGLCAMVVSPQRPPWSLGQGFGSYQGDGEESDLRVCPSPVPYFSSFENQIKKLARIDTVWVNYNRLTYFNHQIRLKKIQNHAILKKHSIQKNTIFCRIFLWSGGPS